MGRTHVYTPNRHINKYIQMYLISITNTPPMNCIETYLYEKEENKKQSDKISFFNWIIHSKQILYQHCWMIIIWMNFA